MAGQGKGYNNTAESAQHWWQSSTYTAESAQWAPGQWGGSTAESAQWQRDWWTDGKRKPTAESARPAAGNENKSAANSRIRPIPLDSPVESAPGTPFVRWRSRSRTKNKWSKTIPFRFYEAHGPGAETAGKCHQRDEDRKNALIRNGLMGHMLKKGHRVQRTTRDLCMRS